MARLNRKRRWMVILGVLIVLSLVLTLVVYGALGGHRFVIGTTGGQVSEGGLVLQSAVGQPVVGGGKSGITLCGGFYATACSSGGKVFLPLMNRPG